VCKFRHLLERDKLGKVLLKAVNEYLRENGIKVSNGTIVDATIISAPSATKNKDGKRDPEMHQTAKGQHWHFGLTATWESTVRRRLSTRPSPRLRMWPIG
jgi:transposase, IS5 family